jgi:hypothetical protein
MQDLYSLLDDHEAIEAVADQLIHRARPGGGSADECHLLLCSFTRQLMAHRAAEASFLQSCSGNGSTDAFEVELRALRDDFSVLADGWASYLERWTPSAITESRAAFGQETTDMMTAFKLRIARENSIIYPLALETGRIALYEEAG